MAMKEDNTAYYCLGHDVENLVIERFEKKKKLTSFPGALKELQKQGKLKRTPPPFPPYYDNMTADQFDDMLLSFPIEANRILRIDKRLRGQGTLDEEGMFPSEKDVFCFKHMPYMEELQHCHEYFEITYMYRGSCKLLFENETIVLTEGDMCIVPPQSPHNQPLTPGTLALGIVVRKSTFNSIFGELLTHNDLVSSFLRNSLYNSDTSNYLLLKTELFPQLRNSIHQLTYEANMTGPYTNTCCVSLLNLVLALILRRYRDTITIYRLDDLTRAHRDFPLILQYIQQNYTTVTLASLARVFDYSESHICRLIQANLSRSFTDIVRELRMSRAQDYLENTKLKIAEITELVGYESVDHFSRTFKKRFGKSPLEHRKESSQNYVAKSGKG